MENKDKIPELRFPEFEEEWNSKELGTICIIKTGGSDTQDRIDNGKYPFFVRSNTVERINKYSYDGEAILTSGDGVGVGKNFHYINGKFDFHQRVYSLREFNSNYSGKFIYQVFSERFYKRVIKLSAKNSVDSVRMDMISKMKINFPTLPEQQKIASFLTAVDEKLTALKKKKELLEQYKKGVMQKLFSREIRFKPALSEVEGDEKGKEFPDWEKKKLGELTTKVGKKNKENIPYPVYSINNKEGFLPQSDQFEGMDSNNRGYDISMYKIIGKNTFAYNPARINVGSIGFSGELHDIIISSLYVCFKTKIELEDVYLMHYLNTFDFNKSVLRNVEGGVRDYLFYENFSNIKIPLPSNKEQTKIANFLSSIDQKINHCQQQIEQTTQWKKGLLQKMFV